MNVAFRRLLGLLTLLLTLGTLAAPARADNAPRLAAAPVPVATAPRDMPLVLEPARVVVPPVPAAFGARDHGWLQVKYAPEASEKIGSLLEGADAVKDALRDALGQDVLEHVEVRVARTAEDMAALAPVDLPPPAYASGVAYNGLHLVLLTLESPDAGQEAPNLDEVFRHELVHVALEDAVQDHHVPLWFNEGLAIHESGEIYTARLKTLWDATLSRTLLPLADLDQGFPRDRFEVNIAYAESGDFVRFLLRDADRARFRSLIARVRAGTPFERALGDAYGTDVRKLEYQWRDELSKRFTVLPVLTGGSFLWVLVLGAMIYGYVKKRRQAKATLERWAREEAIEDALAAARAEIANASAFASASSDAVVASRAVAAREVIEHEGSWYTVH